jgi:hypothetical protein
MSKVSWEASKKRRRKTTVKLDRKTPTGVVRIDRSSHERLRAFSKTTGVPVRVLVSRAVKLLEKDEVFSKLVEAYQHLATAESEFVEQK